MKHNSTQQPSFSPFVVSVNARVTCLFIGLRASSLVGICLGSAGLLKLSVITDSLKNLISYPHITIIIVANDTFYQAVRHVTALCLVEKK